MKNIFIYILFIILVTQFCGVSVAGDKDDESKKELIDSLVIKNGVIISEIEENGNKKFELTGTHGEMIGADVMRIYNVKAFFNMENGERIFIMTDVADFNKKTREMETDEYAEILLEDGVITGVGMKYESNNKSFKIFNNVKITWYTKSNEIGIKLPK